MLNPSIVCLGILITVCYPVQDPTMSAADGATFCQIFQPIRWSPTDTRATKEQADTMNRIWVKLCAKKK